MKENIFKAVLTAVTAGLTVYFQKMMIPIVVLCAVMVIDYITGLVSARLKNEINSRIGIVGIIKKVCYLVVVAVAMFVDWLIIAVADSTGITTGTTLIFGMIVTIWLIINELISILENLAKIGVPMPAFLIKIIGKLKTAVDEKAELKAENESNESEGN